MITPAAIQGINASASLSSTSSANELFALTDEQILEIEPVTPGEPAGAVNAPPQSKRDSSAASLSRNDGSPDQASQNPQVTNHASSEPPPWLAAQMKDPWSGDEARELWNGVQQAQQEAAAYREVFAKPEEARSIATEARALKELYPGGVEQARAATERARTLEDIDAAFFGGAGKSAPEVSAGREALAQRMLQEDPAAFREMVFAGLRALEGAASLQDAGLKPSATQTRNSSASVNTLPGEARHVYSDNGRAAPGADATQASAGSTELAQYTAFEKSANDELERSVGAAITRTLQQALPVAQTILSAPAEARTRSQSTGQGNNPQSTLPALQERLASAIRTNVESALKGDRQLGEQIAQVLSTRRFDDTTRAQVVRLINDRAQQLVPTASRRVIQEWTQTAFATHRAKTQSSSPETLLSASGSANRSSENTSGNSPVNVSTNREAVSSKAAAANRAEQTSGLALRSTLGRKSGVDYGRLSDEQILDL
jgi:hypothetical protein